MALEVRAAVRTFAHDHGGPASRLRRTVALLERRGYALTAERLGAMCLGGPISAAHVRSIAASDSGLELAQGIVINRTLVDRAPGIARRAAQHRYASSEFIPMAQRFTKHLVAVAPFIRSVSIAGSLASGGFAPADDVDLNLIVEDGHRHLAYVALNVLGLVHAMRHRSKPVDDLTRRPLAPRLMTANLILERSECHPLARQDEDMAYEFLASEPLYGADLVAEVIEANPRLCDHFPQLRTKPALLLIPEPPKPLLPSLRFAPLEGVAKAVGRAAWRYMQWTRRHHPNALARVSFVRSTMRPYTLFDDAG